MSELKVLSVASEIFPLVKTGGLADVAGALPAALAREGVEIEHARPRLPGSDGQARRARSRRTHTPISSAARRASSPATRRGSTCSLSTRRISSTGRAIPISAPTGSTGPTMRDGSPRWRGSAPTSGSARSPPSGPRSFTRMTGRRRSRAAYLHYADGRARARRSTIHNLAFQGHFPASIFAELGLPAQRADHRRRRIFRRRRLSEGRPPACPTASPLSRRPMRAKS